ncbi:MAG: hypothetical protein PF590_09175 [Candidatus Delongbacteria bacterium]|jgi:hypothetical protein|nr:hypothetical protein [Candidatus Delongbacteria bacterium]
MYFIVKNKKIRNTNFIGSNQVLILHPDARLPDGQVGWYSVLRYCVLNVLIVD